ncbi:hypothetical protein [Bradyrhizobium diazoefficiens]|uniref:Uncharacterized protein n=1 Tax=Bradyrhizobium diazoefficiens TaxID=1355477 RepID=A0A0E3VX04_9BRAD|nr:hypothetical protein [Bradyrhizobium diazoefficiens]BAR61815.1 hypothetical protein NK6_8666 [Bradyrhizobium diazoefficiens]BCA04099.1 hypothetical protein H12S4_50030 [Bradyrhizobium diazoefficiens]BCA21458.1 hypothetical protein BDHH15_46730 [Bradyrhizobium diazoefficiens]BCE39626.1 hypothetical protein XF3B_46570 [Bradyrhizobium diazoefficiens]BCF53023.1 hypothetical protein XF17B_46610 [Bradyrhizobium diazoefficiens]
MQEWTIAISAIGLAVVILSSVVGLVWKLSRIELALRSEVSMTVAGIQDGHAREIAEIKSSHAREVSELHAKVYQIEIWARDEFVRKGSFELVVARMERGLADLRGEITGRLDKMTDKIDHLGSKP